MVYVYVGIHTIRYYLLLFVFQDDQVSEVLWYSIADYLRAEDVFCQIPGEMRYHIFVFFCFFGKCADLWSFWDWNFSNISQNQIQKSYFRGSSTNSGTETKDLLSPWSTRSQMRSPENQEGIMQMSIGVNSMLFHQVISDWFEIDVVPILAKYQQASLR